MPISSRGFQYGFPFGEVLNNSWEIRSVVEFVVHLDIIYKYVVGFFSSFFFSFSRI